MKSSKNKIIILAALVMGAAFYFYSHQNKSDKQTLIADEEESHSNQSEPHSHDAPTEETTTSEKSEKNTLIPTKIIEDSVLAEFNDLSKEEKKSITSLAFVMAEAIKEDASMDSLVENLKRLNLQPLIMNDQNEYSGEMNVVRTKNSLPGARYLHAQYFTNPDGSKFIEHISFEIKPGKDSFAAGRKIVEAQFGVLKPSKVSEKFISWRIPGRTVWIKMLEGEDLNDPNNSYDPKTDSGTVRIGNELEIH